MNIDTINFENIMNGDEDAIMYLLVNLYKIYCKKMSYDRISSDIDESSPINNNNDNTSNNTNNTSSQYINSSLIQDDNKNEDEVEVEV